MNKISPAEIVSVDLPIKLWKRVLVLLHNDTLHLNKQGSMGHLVERNKEVRAAIEEAIRR